MLKPPPPAPYMVRGPAYFIGPMAFSMESGHGHVFRVGTAGKPYFPALLALCKAYRMRTQMMVTDQKVRPIRPQHGRGSQSDWDSRASPRRKTYDIVGQTCDIVCQHTMSMFNTTGYISLQYCIPDIRYCMSKNVPTISYITCTYNIVCTPPTTSYVFLNLQYRIRYVFLVT